MMNKVIRVFLCFSLVFVLLCPFALAVDNTVKLTVDQTVDATIIIDTDTTYDLNGHTLALAANTAGSVFRVTNNATLTIVDTAANKNGKITGGNAMSGSSFESSELGFNRGEYLDASDGCGGGIYAESSTTVVMTGGTITGNYAQQGGGVYLESGATLHVSGTAGIIGNYSDADGKTADNIFLPLDANNQQSVIIVDAPLDANSRFGITPAIRSYVSDVVLTSGMKDNGVKVNFIMDENGKSLYTNGNGEAVVSKVTKPVPTITTLPAASAVLNGQPLSSSVLTGGEAEVAGTKISGTFAWMNPSIIPVADSEYDVIFTPNDTNYGDAVITVGITLYTRSGSSSVAPKGENDKDNDPTTPAIDPITPPADSDNPFTDIKSNDYFYDAVLWAAKENITSGTTDNTFSPNESCTRGQTVTFLWRAAGSPEPTTTVNPFTDINESDYFYKAVLWAYENGITLGTSDDTFSPEDTVTRGQTVTFLYRLAGDKADGGNSFTDVNTGDYYYDSVLWAYGNDITSGTSDNTFSPNEDCLRGQIVTFIYRCYK